MSVVGGLIRKIVCSHTPLMIVVPQCPILHSEIIFGNWASAIFTCERSISTVLLVGAFYDTYYLCTRSWSHRTWPALWELSGLLYSCMRLLSPFCHHDHLLFFYYSKNPKTCVAVPLFSALPH